MPKRPTRPTQCPSPQWARARQRWKPRHSCRGGCPHQFRACFSRSEPRGHFFNYMVGQCSALERKSIEPMALHVEGGTIRGMQRCMSDDVWDEDHMRQTYHGLVADEMGDP